MAEQRKTKITRHKAVMCLNCGGIGTMQPGPWLRKSDWLRFVILLFCGGAGLIYLPVMLILRADPKRREQICTRCNSTDLYTDLY